MIDLISDVFLQRISEINDNILKGEEDKMNEILYQNTHKYIYT